MNLCKPAIYILLAGTLAGCASAVGTSPRGLEGPIEKAAVEFSADVLAGGYKVVTTADLKKWFEEKREFTIISTLPLAAERVTGLINGSQHAALVA